MPVITVYGVPPIRTDRMRKDMREMVEEIARGVARITELDRNQVSVFFPADVLLEGLGEELVAVILLNEVSWRPQRTMQKVAEAVYFPMYRFAAKHLPSCKMVEAMTIGFQPERHGFRTGIVRHKRK